jgi:hypothetical protein
MIANNGEGSMLPVMICVPGTTFQALYKYVELDTEAWEAPPADMRGKDRTAFIQAHAAKVGCSLSTGMITVFHDANRAILPSCRMCQLLVTF